MGIYGQPNSWQCGPFALKHGLLAVGMFVHEEELTRIAGSSTEQGTDERQLARAARAYGCELPVIRRGSAWGAREEVATHLARGVPVLLCVDNWEHWITAVAMQGDRVTVFDSHYDMPLRTEPWSKLAERLGFQVRRWRGVWTSTLYDLMPLVARARGHRLRLSPERVEDVLRTENTDLAKRWDEYAARLLELAVVPGAQLEFALPLSEFIAKRRESIVSAALNGAGFGARLHAERVVTDLVFVAELYGSSLRPDREHEAVDYVAGIVARNLPAAPIAEPVREMVA